MRELPLPTLPLADLIAPSALRRSLHPAPAHTDAPRLTVAWADYVADVLAAQRLRYAVFAEEVWMAKGLYWVWKPKPGQ